QDGVPPSSNYYQIVSQIIEVGHVIGDVKWTHVVREANQAVESLAKHGLSLDSELNVFHIVPRFLVDYLRDDLSRVASPKSS
ncbi:putative ribonuclease H protein, partial [Trifolium medium]|nr:putative ribonuclease H protein [Trifolium medium]